MDLRLDGKVALITGGSRGIGLATAARFADAGARVMLTSRKAEALEAAAGSIDGEVAWYAANAGEPDQAKACVAHTMDHFGSIDILVNNAGTNPYFGPLADLDVPRAEKTVKVNQTGVLVWTQLAYKASMADRGGSVVNVASIGGFSVEPGIGWYDVTKAAVIHLTRQLASELGPVRVNAIAPGLVRTDLARALWENAEASVARRLPLGRIGEPDDIATAVLFLASDAARWLTGHTLVVDGGALVAAGGGISP
ncbi:MAG: SDR family oxidoreductase [Acidimicrobiales bacterium]|jgi:NAD(P)-dependent dehydrogenase (short-subunit alcohol dehydrogenase family)